MGEPITFEEAKETDFEEILSLINTLNLEWFSKIIPKEYYKEPFLTRKQFDEMTSYMEFFIHTKNQKIIAVGSFSTRDDETAWIPLMQVHSAYQRKGIGSQLMKFLEDKAKALKFSKIHLETDGGAVWALNFYKKHGFSIFKKDKIPWGYHVWLEKILN